jgi:hypothetical protein
MGLRHPDAVDESSASTERVQPIGDYRSSALQKEWRPGTEGIAKSGSAASGETSSGHPAPDLSVHRLETDFETKEFEGLTG